jgi:hypothetical protein
MLEGEVFILVPKSTLNEKISVSGAAACDSADICSKFQDHQN